MLMGVAVASIFLCFFFFQAEDGIRDVAVTGVQTCALPIFGAYQAIQQNLAVLAGHAAAADIAAAHAFRAADWGDAAFEIGVAKVRDRKSTRLNSSHGYISYAVFCLKKKKKNTI